MNALRFGLTPRQRACLDAIESYVARHGSAPTYRELAAALGLRSMGHVAELLDRLEERGAIRRLPARARSIRVLP